jgi:hypothetical protein
MPSTATTRLRLEKQGAGENSNTWGTKLNTLFDLLDHAVAGITSFTLSGSKTLSSNNYAADEARGLILNITSGTGGTVTIPNSEKAYLVRNATSGSVIITTGSGTTVTIPTLTSTWVFCEGSNVVRSIDMTDLWTYYRVSSNFTHATTTMTDVTGLIVAAGDVTADHEYEFDGVIYAKISTGSAYISLAWMPGSTDAVGEIRVNLGTSQTIVGGSAATSGITTAAVALGTAYRPVFVRGHFIPSSSKSGHFKLNVGTVSGTPTITIRAGSFIRIRRTYP